MSKVTIPATTTTDQTNQTSPQAVTPPNPAPDSTTSSATSASTPAATGQTSNETVTPPAGNTTPDAASVTPPAAGDTGTPPAATEPASTEEGFEIEAELLDQAELDAIAAEASRLKLSQEDTQKLVDIAERAKKATQDAADPAITFKKQYDERVANEHKTITADPIFSDAHKEATALSMTRAIETFGSPELAAALNTPELGNNIHLAKFLKKIGDLLNGEGFGGTSLPIGGSPASEEAKMAAMKQRYPSMFNADGTPKK